MCRVSNVYFRTSIGNLIIAPKGTIFLSGELFLIPHESDFDKDDYILLPDPQNFKNEFYNIYKRTIVIKA